MREQQARSGLNLRGDIAAAQQRMELHLDEAEAAIQSGDAGAAKDSLAAAEREVERIEKFLGR
jgi:hypothetical protein